MVKCFSKPLLITKPSASTAGNCFLRPEGTIKRPFASNLQSNSPMRWDIFTGLIISYVKVNNVSTFSHFLPQKVFNNQKVTLNGHLKNISKSALLKKLQAAHQQPY
jgi:hypothetical protein